MIWLIKRFYDNANVLMALLIPFDHKSEGIDFCTNDEDYMQVACMGHPKGHIILPHFHNKKERKIDYTCETLIIRNGILKVTLYDNKVPMHEFELKKGDILTLFSGGHGFETIEDVDMVEIKQGPYPGPDDKTRF